MKTQFPRDQYYLIAELHLTEDILPTKAYCFIPWTKSAAHYYNHIINKGRHALALSGAIRIGFNVDSSWRPLAVQPYMVPDDVDLYTMTGHCVDIDLILAGLDDWLEGNTPDEFIFTDPVLIVDNALSHAFIEFSVKDTNVKAIAGFAVNPEITEPHAT